MTATDEDLLLLLKTRGPLTTAAAAAALGITPQGVRRRLEELETRGLAQAESEKAGVGRPRALWTLRAGGRAAFPDGHEQLAVELIEAVRSEFGDAALDRLIAKREGEQQARYRLALAGADTLGQRLERLAAQRSREGYMAEVRADGQDYLLIEHHCPICAAASACLGFCRAELELFRAVLGPDATVERESHVLSGDARCIYRVGSRGR